MSLQLLALAVNYFVLNGLCSLFKKYYLICSDIQDKLPLQIFCDKEISLGRTAIFFLLQVCEILF